jgi:hypothetical protein
MSQKGMLTVTRLSRSKYSVCGVGVMQGMHLGYVEQKGKSFCSDGKSYPTLTHAVLALARGQNRRFSPRASFHQSRLIVEDELLTLED